MSWLLVGVLCLIELICGWGRDKSCDREYQPDRNYSVKELREDFDVLKTTLLEAHGNLYAHVTPKNLEKSAQLVKACLDRPMTELEFFQVLSPLVAAVRCGHTHIQPSRECSLYLANKNHYLNLSLRMIDHRIYFTDEKFRGIGISPGSEILAINGCEIGTVINSILARLSSDGDIQTQKIIKLEKNFILQLRRSIGRGEGLVFHIQSPDKYIRVINLDALENYGYRKKPPETVSDETDPLVDFQILTRPRAAVLAMKTFYTHALKKEGIRYKAYFRNLFHLLNEQKINNLIIDIRGNAGGSVYLGAELFSYFAETPFTFFKEYRLSSKLFLTYSRYIKRDIFVTFKWLVTQKKNGWRSYPWHSLLKPKKPKRQYHYKGQVFILTDGATFSAASMFAAFVNSRKKAIFIGEETGGSYCGNGISPIHLTLPNTGIRVQIPLGFAILNVNPDTVCSRGIIPDYTIKPKLQDILSETDPALDFVLKLLR